MLRRGLLAVGESRVARKVLTDAPVSRSVARRFVPGASVDAVVGALHELEEAGLAATGNYLGEAVRSPEHTRAAVEAYLELLDRIEAGAHDANISVKLTQLGMGLGDDLLWENVARILDRAEAADIFVRFDMESSEHVQPTLDLFGELWESERRGVGVVLQAQLRRTAGDLQEMIRLGARVRLCKGAYAEPAEIAHQKMRRIRKRFREGMARLLSEGTYPAIATHDERLLRATLAFAAREGVPPGDFEFQMLYGVRRDLQRNLRDQGHRVRVYIPFGDNWYPYLVRRLAERPANVFFMVESMIKESPLGFLWPGRRGLGNRTP